MFDTGGPPDAFAVSDIDAYFDQDAFFFNDPPPPICYPDGGMGEWPLPPGGTPECPSDNARPGCPCTEVGATSPCWPGQRRHRDRGQCRDGVTTCMPDDEFQGAWGPCTGAILPTPGVTLGAAGCACFSRGTWEIDDLRPCMWAFNARQAPDGGLDLSMATWVAFPASQDRCMNGNPYTANGPPTTPPPGDWTTNRITVDCSGTFRLCYRIKAGNAMAPSSSDCLMAEACTDEFWYPEANMPLELPPLPTWLSTDSACITSFRDSGGYGEMTVVGQSLDCIDIDDGMGAELVFNRVPYCSLECNLPENAMRADCVNCRMNGSGSFGGR